MYKEFSNEKKARRCNEWNCWRSWKRGSAAACQEEIPWEKSILYQKRRHSSCLCPNLKWRWGWHWLPLLAFPMQQQNSYSRICTDETLLGKWLTQTEEDRTFVVLGQLRSIFETNILVFNNHRVIVNGSYFEEETDSQYRLTVAACEWLQDISSGAFDLT